MKISDKTKACLWWVEIFDNDFEKYAEALFSDILKEEEKNKQVLDYLMNNKDYYNLLEKKVEKEKNNLNYIYLVICDISTKILNILHL